MLIHEAASLLSRRLAEYIDWQSKEALLTYGFELLIGESLKFGTLFLLSAICSLSHYTLLILLAALPLRLVSGGGHCKTYTGCFITTVSVYLFLSLLSMILFVNTKSLLPLLLVPVLAIVSLTIIQIWAPGINGSRPFTPIEIFKFRRLSKLFVFIWAITCLIIRILLPEEFNIYFITTGLGLSWQSLFVTPWGYKFLNMIEQVFELLQIGGGENNA